MTKIPNWNEYFMNIAEVAATKSKDPNTKVGSCIVSTDNKIVGLGFNGFPPGFPDTEENWKRPIKYDFVCHSEINAILNSYQSVKGFSLYCTLQPCKDCAKLIAAAGIKKVVYKESRPDVIAEKIFKECNIEVIEWKK